MDESPIQNAHLTGFGAITMRWAVLETLMLYAIASLIKCDEERAVVAFWHTGYIIKRDVITSFVDIEGLSKPLKQEFDSIITRMNAAYGIRNTIAHSVWSKGEQPNSITPRVMKARGKIKISGVNLEEEEYTPERLMEESEEIRRLTIDFIMFAKAHLGMVPDAFPGDASLASQYQD